MSLFRKQTRWERVVDAAGKLTPAGRTVRHAMEAVGGHRGARRLMAVAGGVLGATAASAGVSSRRSRAEQ